MLRYEIYQIYNVFCVDEHDNEFARTRECTGCCACENKIDEKVERNTIRKGNGLFNDKKYTEAEIEYRKALEANPSSEIATYNLGAALYKQQKWNDSRN